jgi:hypothetical protein
MKFTKCTNDPVYTTKEHGCKCDMAPLILILGNILKITGQLQAPAALLAGRKLWQPLNGGTVAAHKFCFKFCSKYLGKEKSLYYGFL